MSKCTLEEVVIGSGEEKAIVPINVNGEIIETLIDTGAGKSCIREAEYIKWKLPKVPETCLVVASTSTGTSINVVGWTRCKIKMGTKQYWHTFIICKNIRRKMILGLDFLRKYKIGTTLSNEGRFHICNQTQEKIEAIRRCKRKPILRSTNKTSIPPRTIGMVLAETTIKEIDKDQYFEVQPNLRIIEDFPNLVMLPMYHHANVKGTLQVPICLIYLNNKSATIPAEKIIGVLKKKEVKRVWKEDEAVKVLIDEIDVPGTVEDYELVITDQEKKELEEGEGKFMVSPADIQTKKKPQLKDADIGGEWREAFKQLTDKYERIFSKDSADIGKTPIVQMEIDRGDHPPISQRSYSLALKHVDWVRQEIETLEKAKVITGSVSHGPVP